MILPLLNYFSACTSVGIRVATPKKLALLLIANQFVTACLRTPALTFDGNGAASAHGIDDDVAGLHVRHGEEGAADCRPQRRGTEVRNVPLEQALPREGQAKVHLLPDNFSVKFHLQSSHAFINELTSTTEPGAFALREIHVESSIDSRNLFQA